MTTIAYRNGVLASDSRISNGDWTTPGEAKKIFRLPDGGMIGLGGSAVKVAVILEWARGGQQESARPTALPDEQHGIVVRPSGAVSFLEGPRCLEYSFAAPFYAIGSGRIPALAAMLAGATAKRAIVIAAELEPCTGGAVRFLRLKKGPDW